MIKDVKAALAEHGLNLNVDKCLFQTSSATATASPIKTDRQSIPMVSASEGFKVLGTQFTLNGRTSTEVQSCMAAAWAKCFSLWPILGKRDGNLEKRLRLFDAAPRRQRCGAMNHGCLHRARNEYVEEDGWPET